jgi:hypothetical protein
MTSLARSPTLAIIWLGSMAIIAKSNATDHCHIKAAPVFRRWPISPASG